jgi:hypothetical protein
MGLDRYTLDEFMGAVNDDAFNPATYWVRKIDDNEGCYPISDLQISDLEELNFDVSKISENDLLEIGFEKFIRI